MIDNEDEDEDDVSGDENSPAIPRLPRPSPWREGRGGEERWGAKEGGEAEGVLMSRSVISAH